MMKGFWNNQDLEAPNLETPCKQEPCGDTISRQVAIEHFIALWECIDEIIDKEEWEDVCMTTANEIPSVQPERPKGHWVEIGDEPFDEWECDMCGFVIDGSGCIDPEEYRDVYKFCPNCGADMRGEKHETD